ncbi:hypothetical protein [Paenibacillus cremeus]|uniref:hypothetical protein n=1 Tax=Paenibacillus cremeus TaxID=2163881 RepID=UPI001646A42A|nr:hypothetical protein [Paenibacillus cremeus]
MSAGIHQELTIQAAPARVYEALLSSEQFSQATGGAPTDIQPEASGTFSCFAS